MVTILIAFHRVLSHTRYRHAADWAESWADAAQYSARKRRGAQEDWWKASLETELDRTRQCEFAAPFFNIAKFYDITPQGLAYAMLRWFGIPERILVAWKDYLEGLQC